jgi:hypothetical protein
VLEKSPTLESLKKSVERIRISGHDSLGSGKEKRQLVFMLINPLRNIVRKKLQEY